MSPRRSQRGVAVITAEFVQDRLASIPTVEKTRRKRDSA